jgi:hypothetical protein
MPSRAKNYIYATILSGILLLALADMQWKSTDALRFVSYLLLGLVASTLKVRIPRIRSTISGGFVFVLIGIAHFSFAETMAMAFSTGFVQSVWKAKRRQIRRQLLFNLATLANSAAAAYWLPRVILNAIHVDSVAILLLLAATVYFWINNLSILTAVSLVEDKPLRNIWRQCSLWSYWYFLIQAALSVAISLCIRFEGWVFALCVIILLLGGYVIFKRIARWLTPAELGQRRARRYDADGSPVEVSWTDRNGRDHTITARVIDISELGVRVESPEPISTATVHVSAPQHDVDSLAEIRYSEFRGGKYIVGLELHVLLNKRRLMSFIPPEELDESA